MRWLIDIAIFVGWSGWMVIVPGICYGSASMAYIAQRNWPLAIVYSGYAWANIGLLWMDFALRNKHG